MFCQNCVKLASASILFSILSGRAGKKSKPVMRSTWSMVLMKCVFLRPFSSVFLTIQPIARGFPSRHSTTLKNASGTITWCLPMYCCEPRVKMGPETTYTEPYLRAQLRHCVSRLFHSPAFRAWVCGQTLVMRKLCIIAFWLHLLSAAGHMCPRSKPDLT